MSSPTWVPPATGRFNLKTIEAEIVESPTSKDTGQNTTEAKTQAVETPQSKDQGGVTAIGKVATVEIRPLKNVRFFTEADKVLLAAQESVIAKYIGAFLLVGEALSIIKGRDLQRILDPKLTFDEYCSKKWGFGQAYAYRLISGYECVNNLKKALTPKGVTMFPTNEAQVRPLTSLSSEDQVKAWLQVLQKADGNVTATLVTNIVHGASGKKPDKTSACKVTKDTGASAEHKKLAAIARLVAKALKVTPKKRSVELMSAILTKIQDLLTGIKS